MKFNIVQAVPSNNPRYNHTLCFFEVAQVLRFGLQDLGHEVFFGDGLHSDATNILLGYQFLHGKRIPKEYRCIIYQLEELSEHEGWSLEIIETLRSPSCVVWDFSEQNIDFLARRGIRAILKPIGFHPNMFQIKHRQNKDVDVLFYGSGHPRRIKILRELEKRYETRVLYGIYGDERNAWISRSKIVISIYYYETKLFDDVRLSFLLNNKVFAIVEDSPHKRFADFVVYSKYENLVDDCGYYLSNADLRNAATEKAFRAFRDCPESNYLREALSASPDLDN